MFKGLETTAFRVAFFTFLGMIVVINIVFGMILTSKVVGPPAPLPAAPAPPALAKVGSVNVANGSAVDFWEYKSEHLKCLISIHAYVTSQGSFTQISCSK